MARLAVDLVLMRPGCPVVAAAMGASHDAAMAFDEDTWLTAPTRAMMVYETTDEQLAEVVRRVHERHLKGGGRGVATQGA